MGFLKAYLAPALVVIFMFITNLAHANLQEIGASIYAKRAISLSNAKDMNFGGVRFIPNHSALVQLGTNSNININGDGIESFGAASAGSVDISSDGVSDIEIYCESNTVLGNNISGNNLILQNTEISSIPVNYGEGHKCQGLDNLALTIIGDATVLMGGEINAVNSSFSDGVYSTAATGGSITVKIVYK